MEDEKPSVWSQAISAYRDVEVAKRNQPKLVQGIQQVQTPLARNINAPIVGSGSSAYESANGLMPLIFGVAILGSVLFLAMKRKK